METSLPTLVAPELNSSSLTLRDPAPIHSLRPRHGRRFNHLRLRYRLHLGHWLGHRSRHTCLRDFLLWLSCLRLCAPNLLSLNLIDGCCGHFTERSIWVPHGCRYHAVFVGSIIRILSRDRIQTEFHLALIGLRAWRTFATGRLNGFRVTSRRLKNARQDAWSSRRLSHQWGLVLLDTWCDLEPVSAQTSALAGADDADLERGTS